METVDVALHLAVLLVVGPLVQGVIGRVKARVAGRRGPPLLQPYYDLAKLRRKGAVYSRTTTWVFRLGPPLGLAATLAAGLLVPLAGPAPLSFAGDAILFAYLLGLARFATAAAALDTGSSFEGMGASREMAFSSLAEPALILVMVALGCATGSLSLSGMFGDAPWDSYGAGLLIAAGALGIVILAENSRIPVDDPATHLELTMIHEVMVLDHGGPDLAMILYGASMKLFLMLSLAVRLLLPALDGPFGWLAWGAGLAAAAIAVGLVESRMARLRLVRVPQLLVASVCAAAFAVVLALQ